MRKTILLVEDDVGVDDVWRGRESTMRRIAVHVEGNYTKKLTRTALLDMAGMNRNKFSKEFKDHSGQPFKAYQKSVRLRRAVDLLNNSDMSVTEIAGLVGYASLTHFERLFKAEYGVPPREYRKKKE